MNRYEEMTNRHQAEANAFPFGFAYSDKQFLEMMKKWDLCHGQDGRPTKADYEKIFSIGAGGYIRRTDADSLHEMCSRHRKEINDAIDADKTGEGFIYDMFRYEMGNHEYGLTFDPDDTLDACGLNMMLVQKNPALLAGWIKAETDVMDD